MINFGAANSNNVHIGFGNISVLTQMTSVTIVGRIRLKTLVGPTAKVICGQANSTGYQNGGWYLAVETVGGNQQLTFRWGGAAVSTSVTSGTNDIPSNTWVTFGVTWRGPSSTADFYINGAAVATGVVTTSTAMGNTATGFAINARYDNDGGALGGAFDIDNLVIYAGSSLDVNGHLFYHNGFLTRPDLVDFWWTGDTAPGLNDVTTQESGTNRNGTPATQKLDDTTGWNRLSQGSIFPKMQLVPPGDDEPQVAENGIMSEEMYAEVTGEDRTHFAVEIDLPDGTTWKLSDASLMTDNGLYDEKVKAWAPIKKTTSVWSYNIAKPSTNITIYDPERELINLLGGELHNKLEGQPVREKLISKYVKSSNWFTVFNGIFATRHLIGTKTVQFKFGPNDKPLKQGARLGIIDSDRFPGAGNEVLGTSVPLLLGIHEGIGGARTAHRISNTEYMVSAGKLKSIDEVYEDAAVSAGTWSIQYSNRKGYDFTEIVFSSDPGSDVDITVDCHGVDVFGDGAGYTVNNGADQLSLVLTNYFYSEHKSGAWSKPTDISAPIAELYFKEVSSFLSAYGIRSKAVITKDTTGYSLLNSFAQEHRFPIFFTYAGYIALRSNPFYRIPTNLIRLEEGPDDYSKLTTLTDDSNLKDETVVTWGIDQGDTEEKETKAIDVTKNYQSKKSWKWNTVYVG